MKQEWIVGVGNRHGHYEVEKADSPLDIEKLAEVHALVPDVSLVLHGGTGVPDHQIRGAIDNGVKKINISTELKESYLEAIESHLKSDNIHAMNKLLIGANDNIHKMAAAKIKQFI